MYAIIQTGGKQYKVSAGDEIFIEKLSAKEGQKVDFNVLAISTDEDFISDLSKLKDAKVQGKVIKEGKGKKITVFTYKPKKGEKRKKGHRQPYTKVVIDQLRYKDFVQEAKTEK